MKLLHIDSSILGDQSVSRQISRQVADRLRGAGGAVEVVDRDLAASPLPHLDLTNLPSAHPLAASSGPSEARAQSDAVLEEFMAADIVVVGAPMYNFSVPSQLKAWVDRILVPGRTFRYGEAAPEGLVRGKRVVIVAARGGFYGQGSPAATFEHLETYLRTVFGFIGVTDLEVVVAEGLSRGGEHRTSAVERASAAAAALKAA